MDGMVDGIIDGIEDGKRLTGGSTCLGTILGRKGLVVVAVVPSFPQITIQQVIT